MDFSTPGSSVHGIFWARLLEWVAIYSPFPPSRDLPDPGIEPAVLALQADSLLLSHQESPYLAYLGVNLIKYSQDIHEENYKTLMKEIKEELNKRRDVPYS